MKLEFWKVMALQLAALVVIDRIQFAAVILLLQRTNHWK
jgi:hypothetical protein